MKPARGAPASGSRPAAGAAVAVWAFVLLAVAATLPAAALAEPTRRKPKVPIGVDPGGVAVALIGEGIDYTRPGVAGRLARDGEGEIIGFDLVDRDRLPYAPVADCETGNTDCAALQGLSNSPAEVVLRHAPSARIGVFRVATGDVRQLAEAIGMVAQSPARIVLLETSPPAALLVEAAKRFPQLEFKVPPPPAEDYGDDVNRLTNVTIGCKPARADPAREQGQSSGQDLVSKPFGSKPSDGACASAALHAALAAIVAARPQASGGAADRPAR